MLGSMLGSHSELVSLPEAQFIIDVYLNGLRNDYLNSPKKILKEIERHPRFQLLDIKLPELSKIISPDILYYPDLINLVKEAYSNKVNKEKALYWVEHSPNNIKNTKVLLDIFPSAKFIHIIRDGRAVASSLLSVSWGHNAIDRIANLWMGYIAHGLAAENHLDREQIFRVTYEDLVRNSEKTLKKLCVFLGINFESQMIMGRDLKLPNYYHKDEKLVGQAPNEDRISAWRETLKPREIELFESLAGDALVNLGYSPLIFPSARGLNTLDRLISLLKLPSEVIVNYLNFFKLFYAARYRRKK